MTAALGLAWSLVPARDAVAPLREPFALMPLETAGWTGTPATLKPGIERILGADDYFSAFYRKPGEAEGVDLFLS